MASNFNTKRLKPVEVIEKYEITTEQIRDYLQNFINTLLVKANKKDDFPKDIRIFVISHEFTKHLYAPVFVTLPPEAVEKKNGKSSDKEMADIFLVGNNSEGMKSNGPKIIAPVWTVLKPFLYTKNDKKAILDSEIGKKELGLSRQAAEKLVKFLTPQYTMIHKKPVYIIALDLIRIFRAMVATDEELSWAEAHNGNYTFNVVNDNYVKISDGNFKYFFSKEPRKKNQVSNFESEIAISIANSTKF